MKPFPLQLEGRLGDRAIDRRYRKDLRKLVAYYAPLGFDQGPCDEHYYRKLRKGEEILGFTSANWTRQIGVRFPNQFSLEEISSQT